MKLTRCLRMPGRKLKKPSNIAPGTLQACLLSHLGRQAHPTEGVLISTVTATLHTLHHQPPNVSPTHQGDPLGQLWLPNFGIGHAWLTHRGQ